METIRNLKAKLFQLRIKLSKVAAISSIGRHTHEFLVDGEYAPQFRTFMSSLGDLGITVRENFDPKRAGPVQANSAEAARVAKEHCLRRWTALSKGTQPEANQFYADLVKLTLATRSTEQTQRPAEREDPQQTTTPAAGKQVADPK